MQSLIFALIALPILFLNVDFACAQGVPEVTVAGSRRSFILSVSILRQTEIEAQNAVDNSNLDQSDPGLGFSAEYNLNRYFGFELGIYNIKRRYYIKNSNSQLLEEARRANIPFLFRGWLWDNVSIGAGPFVALRTDNVRRASSGDGERLDTQASDKFEYGMEYAATLNIAYGAKTGLFLEGRWNSPFNQRKDVEINKFIALAGVKIEVDL